MAPVSKYIIDRELYHYKMMTLQHRDNKYKANGLVYTKQEIEHAALCIKSVNDDIFLTDILLKTYPELYFIALVRNGYSLTDGYIRRGKTVEEAATLYNRITSAIQHYNKNHDRFKLIKFEQILNAPFDTAENLFSFVETEPVRLDKLRLKSKKIIKENDERGVRFGTVNKKYWLDRTEIRQILDPNINKRQSKRLTPEMIARFNQIAGESMKYLGYELK